MKWYKFDKAKGSRQKRPEIGKYVLCRMTRADERSYSVIVVGYRKDAAGDKQWPYFVTPGASFQPERCVYEWCDCLPDGFVFKSGDDDECERIVSEERQRRYDISGGYYAD